MTEYTDWIEERSRHVTASEIGAILGHGYTGQNAFTVWDEKVNGTIKTFADETVLNAGNALEDVAARAYERMTGNQLFDPGRHTSIEHPDIPWISCTVDRVIVPQNYHGCTFNIWRDFLVLTGTLIPVEIKWMGLGSYVDRDEWLQDQPLRQQLQLQCQMSVLGTNRGVLLGAFVPGCDIHPVEKEFDPELWSALLPVLEKFCKCVENRITPNPDDYAVDCKSMRRIFDHVNRKTIKIDRPEDVDAVGDWINARHNRLEWDRREKAAQARVLAIVGENAYGALPDGSAVKRTVVQRKAYTVEESSYIKLDYKER